jgi:aminobenzoyl-glutamate transport protein
VAVVFVAMIGVGVSEEAGLMAALIRKLVKVAPEKLLTFIIVLVGGLSSVATDAGYLILIPLAAAAFLSVGRHPLAGLAAAYAGVSAGFAVNVLLTPLDGLLTEVTNEAIAIADPNMSIDLTANLWFAIASTIFVAIVITFVAEKITERSLGPYVGEDVVHVDEDVPEGEPRGLRFATWGVLAAGLVVVLLTVLPDAPLRNPETGAIFNNSPLMDSLIFIITMLFLVAGICYGLGAKTITSSVDVINAIVKNVRQPRRTRVPAAADQPVHRLLQLLQHAHRGGGEDGRLPGERRHRRALAADRIHHRDPHPRPDHSRSAAEVGDLRPDLRAPVPSPRRRAADRARRLPRR